MMVTSKVWTDDSKLLQQLNLTTRQPHRAPHHVIQATMSYEWRTCPSKVPMWRLEVVEPATFRTEHHHSATVAQT